MPGMRPRRRMICTLRCSASPFSENALAPSPQLCRRDIVVALAATGLFCSPSAIAAPLALFGEAESRTTTPPGDYVRAYDGHVALRHKGEKTWYDVKCDLQVPALLLFRDPFGNVYYGAYAGLEQIDLSDDDLVARLAEDSWELSVRPLRRFDPNTQQEVPLQLSREGFYQIISAQELLALEAETFGMPTMVPPEYK